MSTLTIPAEEVEVQREVDLLVVGGGSAGVAAAVVGARRGLRTMLVEEMPFLGGMSTGACVGTYCGFYGKSATGSLDPLVGGFPLEVAERLLERGHAYGPIPFKETAVLPYVPHGVKMLLEELTCAESLLEVRLHTKLTHAVRDGDALRGVVVQGRGVRLAITADVFVDATGDAALSLAAGAETHVGDELQFPSMMFTMQNVDTQAALAHLPQLSGLLSEGYDRDGLPRRTGNLIPTLRPGEMLVAMSRISLDGRPLNGSDDSELTLGELEGRIQAVRLAEFLRERMPGFADAFLSECAPRLGIRESRRIVGEYALSESDVLGARQFDDGIGRSAWPVERHVAGGETVWKFLEPGTWYSIPYRSLLPRGVRNLLAAGRCIAAEPDGFASVRVIGPCMLEGQAAAVAAQLALSQGKALRDLDVDQLRAGLEALGVPL